MSEYKVSIDVKLSWCMSTLFKYLMTDKSFDQSIIESKNELIVISDAEFMANYDKDKPTSEEFKKKLELYKFQQTDRTKGVFIIFHLDGVRYHFKQVHGDLSISAYKKPSFSAIDSKFKEKPSLANVNHELPQLFPYSVEHSTIINELAHLFPYTAFVKLDRDTEANELCIGRTGMRTYFSKELLALCDHFKVAFSDDELAVLNRFRKKSFDGYKKIKTSLTNVFNVWETFLRKQGDEYTRNNVYKFNDADNWAFLEETDTHVLIEQGSQNTVFAYVKEKSTDIIKVWYSSTIQTDEDSYAELLNKSKDYIEMMQHIQCHYGVYQYPFDIDAVGYFKSTRYYLEHPNDTSNFLVVDSSKGFNMASALCYCLETDLDVLEEIYDEEDED